MAESAEYFRLTVKIPGSENCLVNFFFLNMENMLDLLRSVLSFILAVNIMSESRSIVRFQKEGSCIFCVALMSLNIEVIFACMFFSIEVNCSSFLVIFACGLLLVVHIVMIFACLSLNIFHFLISVVLV